MSAEIRGDGSSTHDRQPTVVVDRTDERQRWRYRCPNGHTDWDRTNNHIWCPSCLRAHEHGADVDPEHWAIVDEARGEEIEWARVRVVE
jgi:hypothetical protein